MHPELIVSTGEPWKYGKLEARYFASLTNPAGRPTWNCEISQDTADSHCQNTNAWFTKPGSYTLVVVRELAGEGSAIATQLFPADGTEVAVEIRLHFMSDKPAEILRLAELHVSSLHASVPGVLLLPMWRVSAEGQPAYRLTNNSRTALHGVGWFANYFGYVERERDGGWIRLRRGGFCGTVDIGKPLNPGQSTTSIEGFFIGNSEPFMPGKYRYVLPYSTVAGETGGIPVEIYSSGSVYTHFSALNVATAPFEIVAQGNPGA